jgi:predicted deacetylase
MFSAAQYLLRFDDICPTMNWNTWTDIESVLTEHRIKPILAVIPDNQDPTLMIDQPAANFWDRVRTWQSAGWTIALHGYQHRYVTTDGGILRLKNASEFAGLSRQDQAAKLRAGIDIFAREGVRAEAWVAPGHSFDQLTVSLLGELGVHVIVDGFARFPFVTDGVTWVPQQLWEFWPARSGVWTICNHHNAWSAARLALFREQVARLRTQITTLSDVLHHYHGRQRTEADRLFATAWRLARWSRLRVVRGVFRRMCR